MQVQRTRRSDRRRRQVPMTGDALFALGDVGRTELVRGEVRRMSPTGYLHGFVECNLGAALRTFVREKGLGRVLTGEVGIFTRRNPDTVRGVDVAYLSHERLSQLSSSSYLDVAPELVVEVLSPDDRWSDVTEKLSEYFSIGVDRVWVADPRKRQVHVYRSPTSVEVVGEDDLLPGGDILPGLDLKVAEIFSE